MEKSEWRREMKVVYCGGQGEIIEKKSRFIATVRPVESEEEALLFIQEMKKKYWDARHNCSAFVIGEKQELARCSDDGEPSQTAGRPMLDILLKENLHNTAVVVTRYFGGTLLGTGGLVRAYQRATTEGLLNSQLIELLQGRLICLGTDYNGLGRIQFLLGQKQIHIVETTYTHQVEITIVVPEGEIEKVKTDFTEVTNGGGMFTIGDIVTFAKIEKDVKIFKKKG